MHAVRVPLCSTWLLASMTQNLNQGKMTSFSKMLLNKRFEVAIYNGQFA